MKKTILPLIAIAALCCIFAFPPAFSQQPKATPAKHKVVFQLNAPAPSGWDQIFNNVINIQRAFKEDGVQVEIVFFGNGLPMLLKTNTAYAQRLKEAADKGVILAACQNSMRVRKVKSEDLFPFATEVDSGVAELVRKQEAGWAYIRGGE
ncbi:MAG: DsrE family protein [Bryobacteraceae bacterium]|jgi:intracellular sulfur oxidation DsrE/DsrF family protein